MKNFNKMCILLAIALMWSCSKSDDYKKYLENGEIRYAAKPEELKAFSGKGRVKLQWLIISDQNITKAKIYWRNKSDSVEVPISRGKGIDTISTIIPLTEGSYSFDVQHFHADGVFSLKENVSSNSYGSSYENTLINRLLKTYSWTPTNQGITMNWGTSESMSIGTKVNYININNDPREFIVLPSTVSSSYTRLLQGSQLEYRTMFKPDSLSIDTFYSDAINIKVNY